MVSRGMWTAVAACLIIVAGTILYNMHQVDVGFGRLMVEIARTSPHVYLKRGNERILCVVGVGLAPGDVLRTGAGQFVTFTYTGENTRVDVGENAEVRLKSVIGGKKLDLRTGVLDATVEPQPEGRPFVVETAHALCRVKGTVFSVRATESRTRLETTEGLVEIERKSDGEKTDVAAGRYAVVEEGVELTSFSASDTERKPFRDIRYRDGRVLFETDFSEGIGNWVALKENGEPVEGHLSVENGMMVLDSKGLGEDVWIYAKMKTPFKERRLVIECETMADRLYYKRPAGDFGTLRTTFVLTPVEILRNASASKIRRRKWYSWRKEYVSLPSRKGIFDVHSRFYRDGELLVWGTSYSRRDAGWFIHMSVRGVSAHVRKVIVRELVPVEEDE